jgi:hypothetical protein
VGVEKTHFSATNGQNFGDGKCLAIGEDRFITHPNATLFLRIL